MGFSLWPDPIGVARWSTVARSEVSPKSPAKRLLEFRVQGMFPPVRGTPNVSEARIAIAGMTSSPAPGPTVRPAMGEGD